MRNVMIMIVKMSSIMIDWMIIRLCCVMFWKIRCFRLGR